MYLNLDQSDLDLDLGWSKIAYHPEQSNIQIQTDLDLDI